MAATSAMKIRVLVTRAAVKLIFTSSATIVAFQAKASLRPTTTHDRPQGEVAIRTTTRTLAVHQKEARRAS